MKNLAQLKLGRKGIIKGFSDKELSLKLLEMGCLPGSVIEFKFAAPLGDPVAVKIAGYTLLLRISEASTIIIDEITQ